VKGRLIHDDGKKTYAIIFEEGDEFISGMESFALEKGLDAAEFRAIGGFSSVVLEYFNRARNDYDKIPIDEQLEVLALNGNIALKPEGGPRVHAHTVVGRFDATTRGGHIDQARVWPTLEVILEEAPVYLKRRVDPRTGLALIDLDWE
jgi:predicted DNA-binding protein with PD1-like motif